MLTETELMTNIAYFVGILVGLLLSKIIKIFRKIKRKKTIKFANVLEREQ